MHLITHWSILNCSELLCAGSMIQNGVLLIASSSSHSIYVTWRLQTFSDVKQNLLITVCRLLCDESKLVQRVNTPLPTEFSATVTELPPSSVCSFTLKVLDANEFTTVLTAESETLPDSEFIL